MIDRYLTPKVVELIRDEIDRAGGNEILFFGWTDEQGRVERAEVVARGNDECVTIPLEKSFLPDVVIHNHPCGRLEPSGPDLNIASITARRGVGFLIIDNDVRSVYAVVEPVLKRKVSPLDADRLASMLSLGSTFAKRFSGFEEREGQKRMVEYVCESFNQDRIALIEAGTGIGKSIAYLLPAVEWSVKNKERVVISTNTINLQEQLLHKDIPDLEEVLDLDFAYILMKGRGNYVCLNRLSEVQQDLFSFLEHEEIEQFNALLGWADRTEDGSLSDLPFIPKSSIWEKVNSQTEICSGGACRYFSRCFFNAVRRKAVSANIIVTNHHYLIADAFLIGSGSSILPPYERAILDEAHNLENAATSFFTHRVSLSSVLRTLNRLYSGPRKRKGYLVYLLKRYPKVGTQIDEIIQAVSSLKLISHTLFESVDEFFSNALYKMNSSSMNSEFPLLEVNEQTTELPGWEMQVIGMLGSFHREYTSLLSRLFQLREEFSGVEDERIAKQLDGFITRVGETLQTLDTFLRDEDRSTVRWIEKKRETAFVVSLIDVGSTLKELIFRRLKNGVLTSATLTVSHSFDFIERRLSLGGSTMKEVIASPFQYDEQMAVLIPADSPALEYAGYTMGLSERVKEILQTTGGRAFVLFTSYRILNDVYDRVRERLEMNGIILFKQGTDARGTLLDGFKINIHSVLFGTESFWEGVDAPGETLECVVITKLPFKVPTEPVTRARMEYIRQEGGNPFLDYTLPLAVIKMKQGIGRLIRKRTDRGIIVILDGRILSRSYGTVFLDSLPGGRVFKGPLSEILKKSSGYLTNNSLTK